MKIFKKIYSTLLIVFFLVSYSSVLAATDDSSSTKQRTTGTYLPVLAQQKTEKIFDNNSSDEISLDDGSLTVNIERGTYQNKLRFSIRRVKWENNTAVPALNIENEYFIGQDVFEITATDDTNNQPVLKFDKPIMITFRYLDEEIKEYNEDSLKLHYFDRLQQKWLEMSSNTDKQANSVTASTDHLSLFAFTANKIEKKGIIGTNFNFSIGQTAKNTALIIVILAISLLGGWYVYKTYLQAKKEIEEENKMTIVGGEKDKQENIPENNKKEETEIKEDEQKGSDENQIWIDF